MEAVELLLQWEEEHHVPGEPYVRTQLYDFFLSLILFILLLNKVQLKILMIFLNSVC